MASGRDSQVGVNLLQPTVQDGIIGVRELYSTSLIRSSYLSFFSSCFYSMN